ncbi:copper homeostasis protein CutC [uncultured Anaerococcus sp.]|uniref:copper homeostasis protein CutC n=1 Tax=uncultured Anaerococcus sp. TaxID=293428 RepID=UPI00280563C2|nr:copper homeostasis protein CutC [uncultured Anaerococcus sp.]
MKLEMCIDSYESFLNAKVAGADRVEICSALDLDGISPSVGLVSKVSKEKNIEKFVMIRPRPYDFSYNNEEFETMKEEIKIYKDFDIDGFVFGILLKDGRIDLEKTKELVELARPKEVTFHRAFDYSKDGEEVIEDLIEIGIKRILTSGKRATAIEGIDLLARINLKYKDKIEIMAGSGVNYSNIEEIYRKSGIENFHMSAKNKRKTEMTYLKEANLYQDIGFSDRMLIRKAKETIEKLS